MSEELHYLLAQSYELTAQTMTVTDSVGTGRSVVVDAGWYRTRLASFVAAGTSHTTPKELLLVCTAELGAGWLVSMGTDGRVRVTYSSTDTGEITLPAALQGLLGFASATIGPLATGATATANYLPTHCVFAIGADDEGWQAVPGRVALQDMPDGTVYGWQDGRATQRRTITLTMLPRDDVARASIGAAGTNALASTTYRLNAAAGEPAQAAPWSVPQTLATAVGIECGWTDRLPEVIAGSVTTFDRVYLSGASYAARSSLSIPGYDLRRSVGPLDLSWAGEGST